MVRGNSRNLELEDIIEIGLVNISVLHNDHPREVHIQSYPKTADLGKSLLVAVAKLHSVLNASTASGFMNNTFTLFGNYPRA